MKLWILQLKDFADTDQFQEKECQVWALLNVRMKRLIFFKICQAEFHHNNVDHCTRLCHASSVAALVENVGSAAVAATFNEIENADVAIVIGADQLEPSSCRNLFQTVAKRGKIDRYGPSRAGAEKSPRICCNFDQVQMFPC